MSVDQLDVFVICRAGSIEQGGATGFALSRYNQAGQAEPFPIFIVRTGPSDYIGYVNRCPHEKSPLDAASGDFFTQDRRKLQCGEHGATFDISTGLCGSGPCDGRSLEPVAIAVIDGEVCLCGVRLVEDDSVPDPFADDDEGPEVVIQPD